MLFSKLHNFRNLVAIIFFVCLGLVSVKISYADVHIVTQTTGSSSTSVTSNIESESSTITTSNSNVHTRIEIDNNGEKKVLDEDGPGNYHLESNSGGENSVTVNNTTVGNITNNLNEKDEEKDSTISGKKATDSAKISDHDFNPVKDFFNKFFENFRKFLNRIFKDL